jgi:type VI protein secretion system component VasF
MEKVCGIEKVCGPVISALCNYWQLVSAGYPLEKDVFRSDIETLLAEAKEKAAEDPETEREYAQIELPLVFFIDYMVKEGTFPFKNEWRVMSRKYNELSGDEKFFDLLSKALDDATAADNLILYNLMLSLGFDGAYRSNPAYIAQCMKRCAGRIPVEFNIRKDPLTPLEETKESGKAITRVPRFLKPFAVLLITAAFALGAFLFNMAAFMDTTGRYRRVLSDTINDAVPKSAGILYAPTESPPEDEYEYPEPAPYPETPASGGAAR